MSTNRNPWPALFALVVGFFMLLLDVTIVAVANPAIMASLHADVSQVIWVTSAYLLTYAVPLLVTGRLGDRFGPKNIYLIGLAVFTGASLWCGLSGSIVMLIAARAAQGVGAALMTPQTMAVITRTFPPDRRGAALGVGGGVAGLATLTGPLLGGVLVDRLGWEWIFIVNVPVGVVAFGLVVRLVPALPTHTHTFDVPGMLLSGVGMFLLVYGVQEGADHDWSLRIWLVIGMGVLVLGSFVVHQARHTREPLMPLSLFRDRNFALASAAIAAMGAAATAVMVPVYFYLQAVRGMSSTMSALLLAPNAVIVGLASPVIGKLADRVHPRVVPTLGFSLFAISVLWFAALMQPDSSLVWYAVASGLAGFGNACIWARLTATAMHDLPVRQAGAGSGVYNTMRQGGSVLGSAAISALIAARMTANGVGGGPLVEEATIPDSVKTAFGSALGQSTVLPAGILLLGAAASALLVGHSFAFDSEREVARASRGSS
ncbi:DHA2 family efflux MFS transporter permease subunit [Nocardia sp. CNY236]|uniref:DHA2 family efflux MFS transporter permease subunit n=1 Tax=Nocardia sp. CNY236 TaxID=1169152 RepID=UPI0005648B62|nr:DHA2 family efflux MFS transporter permease subunit [Nocardia sp. CNY236]